MPHQKLQRAIEAAKVCCGGALIRTYPTIKGVQKFTNASPRAIKEWRRKASAGLLDCFACAELRASYTNRERNE